MAYKRPEAIVNAAKGAYLTCSLTVVRTASVRTRLVHEARLV